MAFRPPQRHQQHRPPPLSIVDADATAAIQQRKDEIQPLEESQEWILFSPDDERVENYTSTASTTDRTARTGKAATAQSSELGSLDTAAVSSERVDEEQPVDDQDDENEDLDSLDDGLHAFNEPLSPTQRLPRILEQSHDTVLPAHDGLGKFPGNSSLVQEQFWQHEKYNPRRRRLSLRRSSLHKRLGAGSLEEDLAVVAAAQEQEQKSVEEEKFQRIEQWRMEQSKAIMEEIEKETRRIRRRHQRNRPETSSVESEISRSTASAAQNALTDTTDGQTTRTASPSSSPPPQNESFWQRFTRKVIRDFMGFDDRTLALIFGESLASDYDSTSVASFVEQAEQEQNLTLTRTESWEDRLLARIAKELGTLINHISAHPGAFSTFLRTQEPIPYAGISNTLSAGRTSPPAKSSRDPSLPSTAHFAPTLSNKAATANRFPHSRRRRLSASSTADPSLWGIEEEAIKETAALHDAQTDSPAAAKQAEPEHDRDYWEKDLDVKMVFEFLRNRISSPFSSSSTTSPTPLNPLYQAPSSSTISTGQQHHHHHHHHSPLTPNLSQHNSYTAASSWSPPIAAVATSAMPSRHSHHPAPTADTLRRAALIRQHHPLVSRSLSLSSSSAAAAGAAAAVAAASSPLQSANSTAATAPITNKVAGAATATAHTKVASPLLSPILGQRRRNSEDGAGSCASQSTKRSKTARSGSISSRNYWDIGGGGAASGGATEGAILGGAWSVAWGEV